MPPFVPLILHAWGITAVLMLIVWLIAVKTKNAGWVDVGWALGLVFCVSLYAVSMEGLLLRRVLLVIGVSLWALRLMYHLIRRFKIEGHEDKRYQKIRNDWKTYQDLKFFFFFQFQALLDVILSVCWLPSMYNSTHGLHFLEMIGILIWVVGFIGESIADGQLKSF